MTASKAAPPGSETGPRRVTVRYWAAAKAAAGTAEEAYGAASLLELMARARERHAGDTRFERVLGICSLLVDGTPVGTRALADVALRDGSEVEVLPPFAGG